MAALMLSLCIFLCGCASLLDRGYTSETEHADSYHEKGNPDILSASNYQELINTILMLLESHADNGIIHIPITDGSAADMARKACDEIQNETALGAYLLHYITCSGSLDPRYYELRVSFSYRRSESQHRAMIHASSLQALPDLIASAHKHDSDSLCVIFSSAVDPAEFTAIAESVRKSTDRNAKWSYTFYPNETEPSIAEINFDFTEVIFTE